MDSSKTSPIRVYQPILYGPKPSWNDLTCSFVGGSFESPHRCSICCDPLFPLVQLHHAPRSTTTQVWACNRVTCFRSLFSDNCSRNALHYGGNGVVVANRYHNVATTVSSTNPPTTDSRNEWDLNSSDDYGNNKDLNLTGKEINDLHDLEQQLASLETHSSAATKPRPSTSASPEVPAAAEGLPGFALHSLPEPPARSAPKQKRSSSDAKIQQMLQQYLRVEEDEGLRQMLLMQGSSSVTNSHDNASMEVLEEPDETDAVTEDQAALQSYTERLQRLPRQVVRCGRGNRPLWSIPVRASKPNEISEDTKAKKGNAVTSPDALVLYGYEQPISPCATCNSPLQFELQLLPSLLHALRVDDHVVTTNDDNTSLPQGMDWGNIAVYTCSNSSCVSEHAYCIVQDSIDGHAYAHARARQFQPAIMEEVPPSSSDAVPIDDEMDGEEDGIIAEDDEEDDDECI
jgi:Programmed cell death protein 2, C-terminal putative domain